MRWHIMERLEDTRSVDEMIQGEPPRRVITGWVLLRPEAYEEWKQRYPYGQIPGRPEGEGGAWRAEESFSSYDLCSCHRLASRLPTVEDQQHPSWPHQLPLHDRDRFWQSYQALEPRAWRFFERHLRYDPLTVQMQEGLSALQDYSSELESPCEWAMEAGLFYRWSQCLKSWRGRPVAPDALPPVPLSEETQRILQGWRTQAAARRHCEDQDERAAAALLQLVHRWMEGREIPVWVERFLQPMDLGSYFFEDALREVQALWSEHSQFWLTGAEIFPPEPSSTP